MKISELIALLNELKKVNGDLPVFDQFDEELEGEVHDVTLKEADKKNPERVFIEVGK